LRIPGRRPQAGEELDEVAELGLGEFRRQVGRHGRGTALALLDGVLEYGDRESLGGEEPDLLVVLAPEDAGDDLAVAGGPDDRFEPLGDLLVGVDDRLEQILAVLPRPDAGELGTDIASRDLAGPDPGLVTPQALGLGLVGEDGPAALGVAAGEDLAVGGEWVIPGLGGLVLLELPAELGFGARGHGLDQVELNFRRYPAGDEPVEPAEQGPSGPPARGHGQ